VWWNPLSINQAVQLHCLTSLPYLIHPRIYQFPRLAHAMNAKQPMFATLYEMHLKPLHDYPMSISQISFPEGQTHHQNLDM
jgi:hypothetical protein